MAEPLSTTSTAVAAVGLSTILVGWLGPVAAEFTMIILAALSGCAVALSRVESPLTFWAALRYVLLRVCVAVTMSSVFASIIGSIFPSTNTPYSSAGAAFVIGIGLDRLQSTVFGILDLLAVKKPKKD